MTLTTSPTEALWARLAHPIDHDAVVEALLGLTRSAVQLLGSALLVTSPEVEDLLGAMPHISRSMAIATTDSPQRTVGHVRGPILWSETVAARASSFGDEGLFVCQATERAYDTAENRVLAHALWITWQAARTVESNKATGHLNLIASQARQIESTARRWLDHRTLHGVPTRRPNGRDLRRTRSGNRRTTYRPALDVLERASIPFVAEDVAAVADDRTSQAHRLLATALEAAERRGASLPGLRAIDGALASGLVAYRHPDHRSARRGEPAGVLIGDTPVPADAGTAELEAALAAVGL